jgi:hypothetical protein
LINQHEFKIHRKLPFLGWRLALPTSQSQLDLPENWFQKVLPILENEKKKKNSISFVTRFQRQNFTPIGSPRHFQLAQNIQLARILTYQVLKLKHY